MTAPNGSIVFNNSTGSDTQASGLGPANAVYGTGASTTGASAVVTGIDTTGVTAGDLLWVQSSSGRQFSIIASVDSSTEVTCDDVFANTESGRTWGIGGKRATLDNADSRRIFGADTKDGFTLEIEHTGTAYDLTSRVDVAQFTPVIEIKGTGASRPVIRQTANTQHFYGNGGGFGFVFRYLQFTNSSGTPNVVFSPQWNYGFSTRNIDCVFGDATDQLSSVTGNTQYGIHIFKRCEIKNTSSNGITCGDGNNLYLYDCTIHHCGGSGVDSYWGQPNASGCIFYSNSSFGIYGRNRGVNILNNCIFYNNASGGVRTFHNLPKTFDNNIFVSNGGYGATFSTMSSSMHNFSDRNVFYNNTSGEVAGATLNNSITLTADPFVNAANGDFNINTSNGGGAALRSTSYDLGG